MEQRAGGPSGSTSAGTAQLVLDIFRNKSGAVNVADDTIQCKHFHKVLSSLDKTWTVERFIVLLNSVGESKVENPAESCQPVCLEPLICAIFGAASPKSQASPKSPARLPPVPAEAEPAPAPAVPAAAPAAEPPSKPREAPLLPVAAEEAQALEPDAHLGHEYRGLSVDYLVKTFMAEVLAAGLPQTATVSEVEPRVIRGKGRAVICPRDGLPGAAYVDCVRSSEGAGLAELMLSYHWEYSVEDIVESLVEHCRRAALQTMRTRVWMCCFCVNQHRSGVEAAKSSTMNSKKLKKAFGERVLNIGRLLALMAPWKEPVHVKRTWCTFELYTALELGPGECHVDVAVPPKEAAAWRAALLSDGSVELEALWRQMGSVSVEATQASVPADREGILKFIRDGPGVAKVDTTVRHFMRSWVVNASADHLRRCLADGSLPEERAASVFSRLGGMLLETGTRDALKQAEKLLEQAQELHQKAGTLDANGGAWTLGMIGKARNELGDARGAVEVLDAAWEIHKRCHTLETVEGAQVLASLGLSRCDCGDAGTAPELCAAAERVLEQVPDLAPADKAHLMCSIGAVRGKLGDPKGSLEMLEGAVQVLGKAEALETPAGASLLARLGAAAGALGDSERELATLHQAQAVRERTGTLETSAGAELLKMLGAAKERMDDPRGALEVYEAARRIREKSGTLETQGGYNLVSRIANAKLQAEDISGSLEALELARGIRERNPAIVQTADV